MVSREEQFWQSLMYLFRIETKVMGDWLRINDEGDKAWCEWDEEIRLF